MNTTQLLLRPTAKGGVRTASLCDSAPGDMGWVVQQHGEIYAREYGFGCSEARHAYRQHLVSEHWELALS